MNDDLKQVIYDYLLLNCASPIRWFSEREIAEALQIKRSAVRETLIFMEGEGIVSKVPQRGYRCIDYSQDDMRALQLLRFTLEHSAVMKALTAAQSKDIEQLIEIKKEMDQAFDAEDINTYMLSDMKFHAALIDASHDHLMKKIFSTMKLALYASGKNKVISSDAMHRTHQAHQQIFDAFIARNFSALEQALCDHIGGGNSGSVAAIERLTTLANAAAVSCKS